MEKFFKKQFIFIVTFFSLYLIVLPIYSHLTMINDLDNLSHSIYFKDDEENNLVEKSKDFKGKIFIFQLPIKKYLATAFQYIQIMKFKTTLSLSHIKPFYLRC